MAGAKGMMQVVLVIPVAFIISIGVICLATPIAIHVGLVDRPGGHKQHQHEVPLVGGLALYIGLFLSWYLAPYLGVGNINFLFIAGSALLFVIGIADDYFQLSVSFRIVVQVLAALLLTYCNIVLTSLGQLLPGVVVETGVFAIPFTVFAVVGTINAMNMIDGVDGLAGLLSFVVLLMLGVVSYTSGNGVQLLIIFCMLGAVGGFLHFNLRRPGREHAAVFMGDAGSTILGFLFAYLFISLSQGESPAITPVTALWLFGVPLMDTIGVMARRIWLGRSPFSADRGHLHHLLLDAGFRVRHTVMIIAAIQLLLGTAGLVAYYFGVLEWVSFAAFLGLFAFYAYFIFHPRRAVLYLRNVHQKFGFTVRGVT